MGKRTKTSYSSEFKQSSAKLAVESNQPVSRVAKELGINLVILHGWINKHYPQFKKGLIWHTDRGSPYASDTHQEIIQDHGILQSMRRRGNCWDNTVAESFFHTLKTELTHHHIFTTRAEAKNSIFKYIEIYYNRKRMHSANDYMSSCSV